MSDEKESIKIIGAVVLSSGITFGGTQLINEEIEMCKPLIQHEARHKDSECAIKLKDCEG